MLTTGFVDMIHMALISPRSTASNRSTAFSPGFAATRGAFQKRATRVDVVRREIHVRRELIREPADLAPAHRVRLARQRERPHARLADAARREMHVDDRVDLVGAARRLIDALRERGDGQRRAREPAVELEHVVLGEPARGGDGRNRRRAFLRDAQRGAEALRMRVEELEIERILAPQVVQQPVEQHDVGAGAQLQEQIGDVAGLRAARVDDDDAQLADCAAFAALTR